MWQMTKNSVMLHVPSVITNVKVAHPILAHTKKEDIILQVQSCIIFKFLHLIRFLRHEICMSLDIFHRKDVEHE